MGYQFEADSDAHQTQPELYARLPKPGISAGRSACQWLGGFMYSRHILGIWLFDVAGPPVAGTRGYVPQFKPPVHSLSLFLVAKPIFSPMSKTTFSVIRSGINHRERPENFRKRPSCRKCLGMLRQEAPPILILDASALSGFETKKQPDPTRLHALLPHPPHTFGARLIENTTGAICEWLYDKLCICRIFFPFSFEKSPLQTPTPEILSAIRIGRPQ